MKHRKECQRLLFLIGTGIILSLSLSGWHLPEAWIAIFLIGSVVLAGLPHGALDPLVAWRASLWRSPLGLAAFLGVYLLLGGLALGFWWLVPEVGLAVFLGYSAWHFAGDWRDTLSSGRRIWMGIAIVSLPMLSHPDKVESVFAILLADANQAAAFVQVGSGIAIFGLVALVTSGAKAVWEKQGGLVVEWIFLVAAGWFLNPLVFFVVYFCGLHSPRHLLEVTNGLPLGRSIGTALVFTLLAVLLGGSFFFLAPYQPVDAALIRITFVGLAVLTVPHMILVERALARSQGDGVNGT